jgi:outer membrane protein
MMFRKITLLASLGCAIPAVAQISEFEPARSPLPFLVRPYTAASVPPIRTRNSERLRALMRAGNLYLTVQDAIALALENNLQLEVARYGPTMAQWQLERSQAGGALPGVPSGASQVGSVANGQGVAGSQAAAGVTTGFAGVSTANAGNATISEIGPIAQTLDPTIQESSVFSHQTTPQPNIVQSVTPVLVSNTRIYSATYQQGLETGGSVSVSYKDSYLNENAPTDLLNPSSAPSLSVTYQQNLLRGFGIAVNTRTIEVSRLNVQAAGLNFKTQVINTVSTVLNLYYVLSADYDDVRAKQEAVDTADRLLRENRIRERLGTVAALDVASSESQLASTQNDLVVSWTALQEQELQLKNFISRTGLADPELARARVVPLDRIDVPGQDDLPPLQDMVRQALETRPDLASERLGLTSSEISVLGTKNGILPALQVAATESDAGLAGVPRLVQRRGGVQTADPYFVGGISDALGQLLRRNFPTNRVSTTFVAPLRNRQAQADYAIDQLQLRQSQITTEKDFRQVAVDVSNYSVAVRQARARYQAAVQNRILEQQLLDAEEKRLTAGLSTPYNVILQQRDLATANSTEIAAKVAYSDARIALNQALGTTLEANHVSMQDARSGVVPGTSSPPKAP